MNRSMLIPLILIVLGVSSVSAQEASSCDAGFRLFDSELLTTDAVCIPENPERITYLIYPSYLYPFGVKPVGSWGMERDATNFPMIADWIRDGFNDIGLPPNLETLTGLEPDLMIFPDSRVAELTDELPLIAPTLIYRENANWREHHLLLGDLFGQRAEAEAQLALVDTRIAELAQAVTGARGDVADIRVAVVRIYEPGSYSLADERYVAVELLEQLGFQTPPPIGDVDEWGIFGDESIQKVNSDVLILIGSTGGANNQSTEGDTMVESLMNNPLWNTLDAFKEEQVYAVGDFFQQSNLIAAHLIIDELARIFAVEIPTVNPYLTPETAAR